jgi:MFS superfamily sulfate permease-like transporter
VLRASGDLEAAAARELQRSIDCLIDEGIRDVVLDLSASNAVDVDGVERLEEVASSLARNGGSLLIAARRSDAECGYVMKRVDPGQLNPMLGVHPPLDRAVFRHVVFSEERVSP